MKYVASQTLRMHANQWREFSSASFTYFSVYQSDRFVPRPRAFHSENSKNTKTRRQLRLRDNAPMPPPFFRASRLPLACHFLNSFSFHRWNHKYIRRSQGLPPHARLVQSGRSENSLTAKFGWNSAP